MYIQSVTGELNVKTSDLVILTYASASLSPSLCKTHYNQSNIKPAQLRLHSYNVQQINIGVSKADREHSPLQDDKVKCNGGRRVS